MYTQERISMDLTVKQVEVLSAIYNGNHTLSEIDTYCEESEEKTSSNTSKALMNEYMVREEVNSSGEVKYTLTRKGRYQLEYEVRKLTEI